MDTELRYDTLTITDEPVISWFISRDPDPREQDEWIQQVENCRTASVSGYTLSTDPLELEIEYRYITIVR